jgi:hypothetical protein
MTDRIRDTIKPTCVCEWFFQNKDPDVNAQWRDAVYYAHRVFKRLNIEGKGLLPLELLKYLHSTACINTTRCKVRAIDVGLQKTGTPRFYLTLETAFQRFFLTTNYTEIMKPLIYYDYIKNTHPHGPTFYYLPRRLSECLGSAIAQAVSRGGPDSRPCLVKWDLWWIKWRWGRFSMSTSVSPANLHFTKFSIFTITRGRHNRLEVADVPSGLNPLLRELKKN